MSRIPHANAAATAAPAPAILRIDLQKYNVVQIRYSVTDLHLGRESATNGLLETASGPEVCRSSANPENSRVTVSAGRTAEALYRIFDVAVS